MIQHVISINNVGTFRNCTATGNTEFRKLTLIHAENGRGKTTLCAILRSLQSNDPILVAERKTLDSDHAPNIRVRVDGDIKHFKDGAWSSHYPKLEIFDAAFVAENVYSGDAITHDHKRNLCRIVIGAEGVKLAEAFDAYDDLVKVAHGVLITAKEAVQRVLPKGSTLEAFVKLASDPEIDAKISTKKDEIAALEDADSIRTKALLAQVTLPQPPATMTATLEKTVEGISNDALMLVRAHAEKHRMGKRADAWLSEGIGYIADEQCPMCAQPLQNSPVIESFRAYFSEEYSNFQKELSGFKTAVETPLGAQRLLAVQKSISGNDALVEFWKKHVREAVPSISFDERIEPCIVALREAVLPLVEQKVADPLVKVTHSAASLSAIDDWKILREEVAAYNAAVVAYNSEISRVKATTTAKNLDQLRRELGTLQAQKSRHEKATDDLVQKYVDAAAAKTTAEAAKDTAKEKLEEYNDKVIGKYETMVNSLLRRFGAAFRLEAVEIDYIGRRPRVGFAFGLRGKQIDPGNEKTLPGEPSFRNTLSSGDRNTLALAFFVAQLRMRSDLTELVVIFDDPFTSLDAYRQQWTCSVIRKMAEDAKQVVVFSHSLDFLKMVADKCETPTGTLRIDIFNKIDSRIVELNLDDASLHVVEKDVVKLRNYRDGYDKDSLGAIRSIRPLLENHIRSIAPDGVSPPGTGWLGGFLRDIKAKGSDPTSPLAVFVPLYDDLDTLNKYTSSYHHDGDDCPAINGQELINNAGICLDIIGRA